MKKFLLMLILFFICGFVSADLCMTELKESNGLLCLEIYEEYANAKLIFQDIFWNVFYERIKLFIILILLMFTPLRDKVSVMILSVFFFTWGYFFMSSIAELGIAGLIVAFASVLPHGLIYASIFGLLLQKRQKRYYQQDKIIIHIGMYLFLLLLFITGCVMESLVAVHFVPWIIRLSLI